MNPQSFKSAVTGNSKLVYPWFFISKNWSINLDFTPRQHVSGYFCIRMQHFCSGLDSGLKICASTRNRKLSGFILVFRTPHGITYTEYAHMSILCLHFTLQNLQTLSFTPLCWNTSLLLVLICHNRVRNSRKVRKARLIPTLLHKRTKHFRIRPSTHVSVGSG